MPGTDLGPREKAVNTKLCSQATDKQLRADRQRISKYMRSSGQTRREEKQSRVKVGIEQGLCGGHSEKASLRGRHHCRLEKSVAPGGYALRRRGNVMSERPGGGSTADVLGRKYEWSPTCRRVEKMVREEVGGACRASQAPLGTVTGSHGSGRAEVEQRNNLGFKRIAMVAGGRADCRGAGVEIGRPVSGLLQSPAQLKVVE